MRARLLFLAALLAASPAQADPPAKLTISYSQQTGDALPLFVTLDAGYFKAHGLDVSLRLLPAQQGVPALLTGQVQVISIGAADALAAAAQGVPIKYVAANAPLFEMQFWARPEHGSAQKLKGQKVGVPSMTGTAYVETVIALKDLGLKPSDVVLTPTGNAQNTTAAMLAGGIAATATTPPTTYVFAQHGYTMLIDLRQHPVPNITTGLAVLASFIPAHRALLQELVAAFAEGLRREKTDKALTEREMTERLHATGQAALDQLFDFYVDTIVQDLPMPETSGLAAAQAAIGANNPKVKALDLSTLLDQSFVKRLQRKR